MIREIVRELWRRLQPLSAHAALPTSHLRLAQVIAVAWLCTGQAFVFPSPWLSPLEGVPELPWRLLLALASTAACVGLVSTRFTRTFAASLAGLIVLESVAVQTWLAHNRLFVAALLATVALSTKRVALLPRLQVALVFAMAALDKLLQPAWREGRFLTSFLEQLGQVGLMWAPGRGAGGANALAVWASTHVGDGSLASWAIIALELAIAASFAFRLRRGAWLVLAFHLGVFVLTGSPMGQFFFAGVASALLLLDEAVQPSALEVTAATAVLAGPWTHHLLPLLVLPWLAWSAAGRRARGTE